MRVLLTAFGALAATVLLVSACIESKSDYCADTDVWCPPGWDCWEESCAPSSLLAACQGIEEGSACTHPAGGSAICVEGWCRISGSCGDGHIGMNGTQLEECEGALAAHQTCENSGCLGGTITCGSDCMLDLSQCTGCSAGECHPGETRACTNCGTQTCTDAHEWGSCAEQGECSPETSESCGDCGTRTCSSSCAWGSCTSQGVCSPGETNSASCGDCPTVGTRTRTCESDCSYGAYGSCSTDTCTSNEQCWDGGCMARPSCTVGGYWKEWGGHLYFKCNAGYSHSVAHGNCAALGGDLIRFNASGEWSMVETWAPFVWWFDVVQASNQSNPGFGWDWTGTSSIGGTPWCTGEPDDDVPGENNEENCVIYHQSYDCRSDRDCSAAIAGFICEWS